MELKIRLYFTWLAEPGWHSWCIPPRERNTLATPPGISPGPRNLLGGTSWGRPQSSAGPPSGPGETRPSLLKLWIVRSILPWQLNNNCRWNTFYIYYFLSFVSLSRCWAREIHFCSRSSSLSASRMKGSVSTLNPSYKDISARMAQQLSFSSVTYWLAFNCLRWDKEVKQNRTVQIKYLGRKTFISISCLVPDYTLSQLYWICNYL